MNLTHEQREDLYTLIFMEPLTSARAPHWLVEILHRSRPLIDMGLVQVRGGKIVRTDKGIEALSPEARIALRRPAGFMGMRERERWDIDKELGILDWDGG